jgi:hypothetical protein
MNLKELTNSILKEVFAAISLIRKCPKPKLAFALNPIWVEVLELARCVVGHSDLRNRDSSPRAESNRRHAFHEKTFRTSEKVIHWFNAVERTLDISQGGSH